MVTRFVAFPLFGANLELGPIIETEKLHVCGDGDFKPTLSAYNPV